MTTTERQQHWQQHLTHWQHSGLSGAQYCQQHALIYHQFTYWKQKLNHHDTPATPTPTPLVPVICPSSPVSTTDALQLHLPGGGVLTGIADNNLNTVIQLLGALAP